MRGFCPRSIRCSSSPGVFIPGLVNGLIGMPVQKLSDLYSEPKFEEPCSRTRRKHFNLCSQEIAAYPEERKASQRQFLPESFTGARQRLWFLTRLRKRWSVMVKQPTVASNEDEEEEEVPNKLVILIGGQKCCQLEADHQLQEFLNSRSAEPYLTTARQMLENFEILSEHEFHGFFFPELRPAHFDNLFDKCQMLGPVETSQERPESTSNCLVLDNTGGASLRTFLPLRGPKWRYQDQLLLAPVMLSELWFQHGNKYCSVPPSLLEQAQHNTRNLETTINNLCNITT